MEDENLDEYEKSQFENGLKLGEQAIRLDEMQKLDMAMLKYDCAINILDQLKHVQIINFFVNLYQERKNQVLKKKQILQGMNDLGLNSQGILYVTKNQFISNIIDDENKFSVDQSVNQIDLSQKVKTLLDNGGYLTKQIYVPLSIFNNNCDDQKNKIEFLKGLLLMEISNLKQIKEYFTMNLSTAKNILKHQHEQIQEQLTNQTFSTKRLLARGLLAIINLNFESPIPYKEIIKQSVVFLIELWQNDLIQKDIFYLLYIRDIFLKIFLNDIEIRLFLHLNQSKKT